MASEGPAPVSGPARLVPVEDGFGESFPDGSALATECFLTLGLVATAMLGDLNHLLDGYGIPSYTAFNALTVLVGAGRPLPPSLIARRMVVGRPTLSGVLKTLEAHGLVSRRRHGSDGRMQLVEPTERGTSVVREALPEVHRFEARLFAGLGSEDQGTLLRLLTTVAGILPRGERD